MKKMLLFLFLFNMSANLIFAQLIQTAPVPAIYTGNNGGARILNAQGETAANPAIGFTGGSYPADLNDGGGGNGIFRPEANVMAFSTLSCDYFISFN